jgi:ubiquinone/menaquinone biosynthesis C-methylase UbiE
LNLDHSRRNATFIRSYLKRLLPARSVEAYRVARRVMSGQSAWPPSNIYEQLYETHSLASSDSDAVGTGPWDIIGRLELAVLQQAGLRSSSTLVDFGCGTGRLAVHAVPALTEGHYIGIDVSQEMLRRLNARVRALPHTTCRVSLHHQPRDTFPLPDASVDLVCAFSVFTHIEHEDAFRYLHDARRVVRSGGRFVFSCLTLDTEAGRDVFLESSAKDIQTRWATVRCISTSREMMQGIAHIAGWSLVDWYRGDEKRIVLPDQAGQFAFGQSVGILE